MSGWLSRAKSLFQQPTPVLPEPFEVVCDCGGKVVGQRMTLSQRPVCPDCERPVFVLPRNVYPVPKPRPNPKEPSSKSGSEPKSTRASANAVVDDTPVESPVKSAPRTKSAPGQKASAPAVVARVVPEPVIVREPRSPFITPLRLIATAIILICGLTGVGLWYRFRIDNAKAIVAKSNDAGMAALKERDFTKAAAELDRARKAVDVLGRKDRTAAEIRRFGREATAMSRLAASSLSEFLHETLSNGKPGQSEPLRMPSLDKDAWVIFDAIVVSSEEGADHYMVDAPVMFREGTVRIEIESSIFRRSPSSVDSGELPRFIFAAQLEQVSSLRGKPPTAVLTLNGKTAFLWTNYETYAAIGFRPLDDEDERIVKSLLDSQLEISGEGR